MEVEKVDNGDEGRCACERGGRGMEGVALDVEAGSGGEAVALKDDRLGEEGGMKVVPPRMVARRVEGVREETELDAERFLVVEGRKGVACSIQRSALSKSSSNEPWQKERGLPLAGCQQHPVLSATLLPSCSYCRQSTSSQSAR